MLEKNSFTYEITRKKNCKNIILKIVHGELKISAPLYTTDYEINRFITSKEAWIAKQLSQSENKTKNFRSLNEFLLFGKNHSIIYHQEKRTRIKIVLDEKQNELHIYLAKESSDEQLMKAMKAFLKKEAQYYFEKRLLELRMRKDVYPIIDTFLENWRIRYMKTAFGLCYAGRGEIVLNTELVLYDPKYVDYVILHELSHFYQQNHSAEFYRVFSSLEPNWKLLKKELNDIHKNNGGWSFI